MVKRNINDLALFGGTPAFDKPLHVGSPNLVNRERFLELVGDMLDRRRFTNNGPYVRDFEERIADMVGVKHCVAVSSGTTALMIAIRALGVTGEAIVPSATFVATAHALQWAGIRPVFCDIDLMTHNIDPGCVTKLMTPRTTCLLGVHLWGRPCATEALAGICRRRYLSLLFDASHAFGCSHQGRMIGQFGDAEVFSFHATKFVHAFEGGAIVTNNGLLAEKMRLLRNFGFAEQDNVISIGMNAKMNEVSAAMGITTLEKINELAFANRQNYVCYEKELSDIPGFSIVKYDQNEKCNYQYVICEIDPSGAGIHRDLLLEVLQAENILARRYFYPGCHRMEPYRSLYPDASLQLPETEKLLGRVLSLPTGISLSLDETDIVCRIIRFLVEHGEEITARKPGTGSRRSGKAIHRRRDGLHTDPIRSHTDIAEVIKEAENAGQYNEPEVFTQVIDRIPGFNRGHHPPLVSILIPAYKPTYFRKSLESAIGQTYGHLEILVGDDCPTDKIREIVLEYAAKDSRVVYSKHFKKDPTVGGRENQNRLFRIAKGEYIKILHDDDCLTPNCIERMAGCLEEFPDVSLVYCHSQLIGPDDQFLPDMEWSRRRVDEDSRIERFSLVNMILSMPMNIVGSPSAGMFRKNDLVDNRPTIMSFGGRDAAWNGDVAMWLALLLKGDAICLEESLCFYRIHDKQRNVTPGCIEKANTAWGNMQEDGRAVGFLSPDIPQKLVTWPLASLRENLEQAVVSPCSDG